MKKPVHFLHIRKAGGTAIKEALKDIAVKQNVILHPHKTRLKDIPEGEKVFFFLRNPVSRFVSGFNSRLREGENHVKIPREEKRKRPLFPPPHRENPVRGPFPPPPPPPDKIWAGQAM